MKPVGFRGVTKTLLPSSKGYSAANVASVISLPVWTDGEQCVSCWRMSWWERLMALLFGRVWVSVLSGSTQPPICAVVMREYLKEVKSGIHDDH